MDLGDAPFETIVLEVTTTQFNDARHVHQKSTSNSCHVGLLVVVVGVDEDDERTGDQREAGEPTSIVGRMMRPADVEECRYNGHVTVDVCDGGQPAGALLAHFVDEVFSMWRSDMPSQSWLIVDKLNWQTINSLLATHED